MKKLSILLAAGSLTLFACSKDDNNGGNPNEDFNTMKTTVLADFATKTGLPGYSNLKDKATTLNNAITALNSSATDANLTAAQAAWRDMRSTWEQCEGYLFGPVEDDNYDPNMDTWPVDYVQMDSLLASSNALQLTDIENLSTLSLRGYHPIEYVLWGKDGKRTAASITARQKQYITSLSLDLKNICTALYTSWAPEGGNYASKVQTAGSGSTVFAKKQEAYIAIVDGLIGICDEVGSGKMKEPFDAQDPQIVESPFSGNSAIDFKNNITGAYNVYTCKFLGNEGTGLNKLVAMKNISLDNEIQQKFQAAIASFNSITVPYEQAILTQKVQCQNTMNAINDLKATLEEKLKPFIITNITD